MATGSVRLPLIGFATLLVAMLVASWIGRAPTLARWGDEGAKSMLVVGSICLGAAVLGLIPVVLATAYKPDMAGQAALAATVIRLLFSMAGIVVYQTLSSPQMSSFLTWAVIYYCLLLVIDTAFSVALVRRAFPKGGSGRALLA